MENKSEETEQNTDTLKMQNETKTESTDNSSNIPKNTHAEFQLGRDNSREDMNITNQAILNRTQSQTQNNRDDAASIASDVTYRGRPVSIQNSLYYNNPYGTPMAYHRKPVISATVAPSRTNSMESFRRQHSSDDLRSNSGRVYDQNRVRFKNPKKEKNNMVLQVVLPSPSLNRTYSDRNLFPCLENPVETNPSFHSESEFGPPHLRQQLSFNDLYSQNGGANLLNDIYLPSNYDYDTQKPPKSPDSSESNTHKSHSAKLPSTPEEKRKMFRSSLSMSLGVAYGILNICLGISFYVIDMLNIEDESINWLAEGFSLYLLITALLYFLFLILDASFYLRKRRRYELLLEQNTTETIEMKQNPNGTMELNITLPEIVSLRNKLDHRYCFNKDRHSNNFFLKLGALGFCSGHLIHSLLILVYRGMSIGSTNEDCFHVITFLIEILYPLYSVVLLFFIFKFSNIIINKNTIIHRLGFMHCISSSLCFWIWTIFRETAEYVSYQKNKEKEDYASFNNINATFSHSSDKDLPMAEISPKRFTKMCEHDDLTYIYQNYSPYLYPFSVEFSILAVGILVIVWQNIGLCQKDPDHQLDQDHDDHDEHSDAKFKRKSSVPESNVAIHADCHAANKGLFAGFVVLVFAIVATIVFFISYYNNLGNNGYMMNRITHVTILGLMIISVIAAYWKIVKLDVNPEAHNTLDNILLMICLPAFFVNTVFSIIPGIVYQRPLPVIGLVFEIVQILIQTPFMVDGMGRSSNSKELRKKKPGRQWVTFLVITNVAMWIMETFEVKSHGFEQYRQEYYSKELWSIVGHICLPLMMFYRFHSAACLGDIWKFAYIRSGH